MRKTIRRKCLMVMYKNWGKYYEYKHIFTYSFVLRWADTSHLNAFGSLIDLIFLGRVLKPFEPRKVKGR